MVVTRPRSPRPGVGARDRPPWLAVAALVLAVIPCCPMASLLGAGLGLVVLLRLRPVDGDGPRPRRGARLAAAAIVAGVASAILWSVVLGRVREAQEASFDTAMVEAIEHLVAATEETRLAPALAVWSRTEPPPPSAGEILDFARVVASRYGALDRVAIVSTTQSGTVLAPIVDAALVLHFEAQTRSGSARFAMQVVPGRWTPSFMARSVRIEDAERGDLALEAGPASSP